MMVAYLQSMRDGAVDREEAQFLRATRRVLFFALAIIIASGIAITALHILLGDSVILFSPAYLFKWLLIIAVTLLTAFAGSIPKNIFEMLIAANWYALFLVHTLAPVTTWLNLLELWAVWLAGFALCWYAASYATHERTGGGSHPVPGVPAFVQKIQAKVTPEEKPAEPPVRPPAPMAAPIPETPAPAAGKIVLDHRPVLQMPMLKIEPTDIPMPANKTTDTPFLPKVPPLQPIPSVPAQGGQTPPAAPKDAPAAQNAPVEAKPPLDPLAVNVMPKSPDQLPKS